MSTRREIVPTHLDDLRELSRFLCKGFAVPEDARFASAEILNWKYFDPDGFGQGARSYLVREAGKIVGHVGICRCRFLIPRGEKEVFFQEVPSLQIIDWLVESQGKGIGAYMMMHAHQGAPTQIGMGTSKAARKVGEAFDYRLVMDVPVYERSLRPLHRFKIIEEPLWKRSARFGRDLLRVASRGSSREKPSVELDQVHSFDANDQSLFLDASIPIVRMARPTESLNHMLRYPGGSIKGFRIIRKGRLVGAAILSLVSRKGVRLAKIVELWTIEDHKTRVHAINTLEYIAVEWKADLVQCYASSPLLEKDLGTAGFSRAFDVSFHIRDKTELIHKDATFHMTPYEGDYAYT